ncbi:odorant receptor 67c-like [Arctopsyche grandis]|uniref:odorant receptor 67c-like n=1 Tax=Arctopsyche grandis TaxID=121162 RepID=UPI00406D7FBF
MKSNGFTTKTQTIGSIISVISFTMKYIILFGNRNEFKQLVEKLQDEYEKTKKTKYWKMMESNNRKSEVIVNHSSNDYNIITILLYTMFFIKSMWLTIGVAAIDCTIVSLATHICSHFKILNKMIRSVGLKSQKHFGDVKNCTSCIKSSHYACEHDALKQLKLCVKRHNIVIKYVDDFERLFSYQMMIDFNSNAVKTCLFIFQASVNTSETKNVLLYIGFASASLLQLFMFAKYGQQIMTESSEIADAAFECTWNNYGKTFRKMLVLILQRAQKPVGLTVGKFYYISMERFAKICSAAASYFTVLRALREKLNPNA